MGGTLIAEENQAMATTIKQAETQIRWLDDDEARAAFEAEARRLRGIGGEEFLRRWDAGQNRDVADDADHPEIMWLAMLIPFVRP